MKKYYLASLILHSFLLLPPRTVLPVPEAIDVSIIPAPSRLDPIPQIDEGKERQAAKKELGDSGLLTKKETIYKTYIDRVSEKIYYRWRPKAEKLIEGKRITHNYTCILWLIVDKRGCIERTLLIQPSGYPGLDEASIEAARGQCVPNVPKSLIEADGYGRLVWRFVIYAD